ncbi:trypsin-like serine protease [Patulibacter sp. NPDC049589]|uniref:trypsin-like serine protease n=1 Tax=Patulibacter sp. NPDC049589 TaxID=3154731 RepID=UPI00344922A9
MSRTPVPPSRSFAGRLVGAVVAASAVVVLAAPSAASAADDAVLAARPAPGVAPRIVGGTQIPITRAPYQASIETEGEGEEDTGVCGGTILDATHVLTAAHCTFDAEDPGLAVDDPDAYAVYAGVTDFNAGLDEDYDPTTDPMQIKAVGGVARHPGYLGPSSSTDLTRLIDDVAVLTLSEPLDLSTPNAQAAELPAAGPNPATGSVAFFSGYGFQDPAAEEPDGKLYGVDTTLAESVDPQALGGAGPLNALFLTTVSGAACRDDSGGGLVVGGRVVGVMSSLVSCGGSRPGLFSALTAGENLSFVRGVLDGAVPAIPRAPRGGTDVTLTTPREPHAGDALTCAAGTWDQGPTYAFTFTDARDGTVLQSGSSARYALTGADVGRTVSCRATATTPGGVGRTPATSATPAVLPAPDGGTPTTPTTPEEPTTIGTPTVPVPPATTPAPSGTAPTPAKLAAVAGSGASRVRQGSAFTLTATVRNAGGVAAKGLRICVRIGSRFSVASRGGATLSAGRLCWTVASLGGVATTRQKAATTVTRTFRLRADRDAVPGRTTAATVTVTAPSLRASTARRLVTIQRRARAAAGGGVTG